MTWRMWRPHLRARLFLAQTVVLVCLLMVCVGMGVVYHRISLVDDELRDDLVLFEHMEAVTGMLWRVSAVVRDPSMSREGRMQHVRELIEPLHVLQQEMEEGERHERKRFQRVSGRSDQVPAGSARRMVDVIATLETLLAQGGMTTGVAMGPVVEAVVSDNLAIFAELRRNETAEQLERMTRLVEWQRGALHRLGVLFCVGLAGVAATMWHVSRKVVQPIRALSEASQAFAEGRWTPIHVRTGDEIERLAQAFNQMAERVQQVHEELEQKVEGRTQLLVSQARELLQQREEEQAVKRQLEDEKAAMVNLMEDLQGAHEQLKTAQAQLLQREKLAGIGQLAAGVAHEINNPAGFVLSNLETIREYGRQLETLLQAYQAVCRSVQQRGASGELLARSSDLEQQIDVTFLASDLRQAIEESISGMLRIKRIVQGLRTYARGDANVLAQIDVQEELESSIQLAWNEIKHKADVVRDYAPLPQIWGYSQQLNQVFINLLVNAAQAIPQHGTIGVRTSAADGYVTVEISDTGSGMSEDVQRRIFEPFFTTKPVGQGTGLGLSIVYNIVKTHHGVIQVRSEGGKGTTFAITLPVEQPAAMREA